MSVQEGPRKRPFAYRREPTPRGLEKMRRGELEPFDLEMYANLNTGALEEYMDARNRRHGFRSAWAWRRVGLGVAVGTLFALVNVYVGLKVGLLVYGAWYVAYLVGMGFGWKPQAINLATGAANGAAFVATGFVYVFPALFLLAAASPGALDPLLPADALPTPAVAIVVTAVAGVLGALWFLVLRRLWVVEDPLPYPSFESFLKLLDMTHEVTPNAAHRARHALRLVGAFAGLGALFAFLRDFPVVRTATGASASVIGRFLGERAWWSGDGFTLPAALAKYTSVGFVLSPLLVATGWFLRARAALVVAAGSAFVWFLAVPLAVAFNVPVFVPAAGGEVGLASLWDAGHATATLAFTGPVRALAAGALIGGGLTALLKMAPTIRSVARDVLHLRPRGRGDGAAPYVPGRGWYEWPRAHLGVMLAVALVAVPAVLFAAGYPVGASLVFTGVLVAASFLLGAIAVKVLGETSVEPVSGTSFLVLLLLFGVLQLVGLPLPATIVMALLGTSVYASAASMTGDTLLDFKNGLYVGTTPASQMKAQLAGLVPGAIAGILTATLLSRALADGRLDFAAPQANAFATIVRALAGGATDPSLLLLGLAIGVLAEALTGAGTAFAIGMFLPFGVAAPLLVGGVARSVWESRWLERRAREHAWNEERKTIRLLDTYMIATGLIVGEAIVGTGLALYLGGA